MLYTPVQLHERLDPLKKRREARPQSIPILPMLTSQTFLVPSSMPLKYVWAARADPQPVPWRSPVPQNAAAKRVDRLGGSNAWRENGRCQTEEKLRNEATKLLVSNGTSIYESRYVR